jgi:carboxylesterase type B
MQAPIPSSSWDGIRDATQQGPVCPQIDKVTQKTIGEEDCLVLNVFTPKVF